MAILDCVSLSELEKWFDVHGYGDPHLRLRVAKLVVSIHKLATEKEKSEEDGDLTNGNDPDQLSPGG